MKKVINVQYNRKNIEDEMFYGSNEYFEILKVYDREIQLKCQ